MRLQGYLAHEKTPISLGPYSRAMHAALWWPFSGAWGPTRLPRALKTPLLPRATLGP